MARKDYIELLTENGYRSLPIRSSQNKIRVRKRRLKKRWVFLGVGFILLVLTVPFTYTYSSYISDSSGDPNIKIAPWKYRINASNDQELVINLADTITDNNYSMTTVIPGTRGAVPLEIDFSDSKVASDYVITLDRSNYVLPDNLKLYADENRTIEFQEISGSVLLDDPVVTRYIYWEWKYTEVDETAEWTNRELQVGFTIDLKQKIE